MPRAKDPIADLKAHRARAEKLKAKEKSLRSEAAQFLGELVLKAGLDTWEAKDLREFLDVAAANGAELSLKASREAGKSTPATTGSNGAQAPRSEESKADAVPSAAG